MTSQEIHLDENQAAAASSQSLPPVGSKCMLCADFGKACRGVHLTAFQTTEKVREYHKALRKAKGIHLKSIYENANIISESTINEYFGAGTKDYKWTTVVNIHNALLTICAEGYGIAALAHSCPASSSEIRNTLAAAELKLAAAELKVAQSEADVAGLMQKLTDTKAKHIAQIEQINATNEQDKLWHRNEIKFWRRFAFICLGACLLFLACVLIYLGIDISHPNSGLIRY